MSVTPRVMISGLGVTIPDRIVTNSEFEKILDTSDEWIVERTGIRERHFADRNTSLAAMSAAASRKALEQSGHSPADVDAILLGTISPDRRLPSTACDVQAILGARRAAAMDIVAACPGFVYSLALCEGLVVSGQAKVALALGAERLSTMVDMQDRSTAILFGDGAGAAVIEPADGSGRGILGTVLGADGTLAELLYIPGGGGADPISEKVVAERSHFIKMSGREVFKAAVLAMSRACDQVMEKTGVRADEIELFVPHQANLRIIEATARHAAIPMDKVMVNVDRFGNTSAASIPLALAQAVEEGRLRKGMLVLLVTFGAGFTWGATVVRW